MALFSVGCLSLGNKNKEAAIDAPPPPPAAYPDTSGAMMAGSSPATPGEVPSVPSAATVAATNRAPSAPPAPVPFSLREGEQLVSHQIQPGENLSTIAAKYNTSVGRIQSANGMTDTRIYAGKTLQVPTSAPPTGMGQMAPAGSLAPAPVAPAYSVAPPANGSTGVYPSVTVPPTVPTTPSYPASSSASGAIAAPPVPSPATVVPPGYPDPASTSYPRTSPTPATTAGSFPTPSFEASRIQFSN